jgi:hypothetical protein
LSSSIELKAQDPSINSFAFVLWMVMANPSP